MPRITRAELAAKIDRSRTAVVRGELAKEFLAGRFWKEHVSPAMEKERVGVNGGWQPGMTSLSLEAIAMHSVRMGGRTSMLKDIRVKLLEWVRLGELKQRHLPKLEKILEAMR